MHSTPMTLRSIHSLTPERKEMLTRDLIQKLIKSGRLEFRIDWQEPNCAIAYALLKEKRRRK